MRNQREGDTILIVGMRGGGEIRGRLRGTKGETLETNSVFVEAYEGSPRTHTAVIFDTHINVCCAILGRYVGGVRPIDGYDLMSGAVITGTSLGEIRCQLLR